MAINQLFKVATEFRFEVGSAMVGASNLQDRVDKLSNAADNTLLSFQKMGVGIAASFGLGSGSVLGIIQKSLQVSEKFKDSQLKLSTIFAANKEKFIGPVDSFNSRLAVSEQILKNIAQQAKTFSLPEGQLIEQSSLLAAQLSSKGLAGTNFDNAVNISRDFLKSAPVLGVSPGQAQNQLLNIIEGSATGNNTLFRRLAGETDAFKEFVGQASKFNKLKPAERVEKLTMALRQFTSQSDEVTARTELISNRLLVLKNTITGIDGILKPLGAALTTPISTFIKQVTNQVDGPFRDIFLNLSQTVKILIPDIETLTINLLQLREASRDFSKASTTLGVIGIIGLASKFAFLGRIMRPLIVFGGRAVGFLGGFILNFKTLAVLFRLGAFVVTKLFVPFAALFGLFQIFSRAAAVAKVEDAKALPAILAKFSELANRATNAMAKLFLPFTMVIDAIAKFIAPLFQTSTFLNIVIKPLTTFVDLIDAIGTAMVLATASLQGFFFAIFQFIDNVKSGKIFNLTGGVGDAFRGGIDTFLQDNAQLLQGNEAPISQSVTNIGKVEIKNQFREQLEPDRIAFSLKSQLMKTAQAPTQARGRNFNRGATTAAFGGQ